MSHGQGRLTAPELWEAMRSSDLPFALMDPRDATFLDANDEYAALFEVNRSELIGLSMTRFQAPNVARSIEAMNLSFLRSRLEATRGKGPIRTPHGSTVELRGWARRVVGIGPHPLIVTSAVDASIGSILDELRWVALAPHVFGLPEDLVTPDLSEEGQASRLEQHLMRIANEIRAAGLLPPASVSVAENAVQRLDGLSPRQRDIVAKLLTGKRVGEIARDMYLTPSTIRNHLTAVFRKFGVHSQIELLSVLRSSEGQRS